MANLPKEELSQEIGKLAARSLATKLPRTWSETPLSGDTDFGLDYMIQLKTQKNEVSFSFYLQLKGTTSPKYNDDRSFISHSFKTSTLEFYMRQEQLVMVALVDLRDNEESLWKCPVYYTWLDDEWFDEHSSKLTKQDSISVKIPTVQLLETSLNVFDFLSNRITEKFAVAKLKKGLKTNTKPVAQSLEMIAEAIVEKPILFKSIEEKQDVPWLHNPEGTYANELKGVLKVYLQINLNWRIVS
ncbi:DUF4365 domain-containing protein [Paraglaciecola aquimarina]|uniref:DUF4365 domain-containing protein n=1 Tax=Paraglaciecola aquimarina TaxID=1235557 RepID=A0ABU3T0I0_9ALTE|nr:DUF4365 domain-containing protein [Paraglaciecola aquimarina]MDU0355766.1 DUF4365 domain-containing protein [Paraglaciecola aquimarina]